ncbi:MAG: NUDIX hydrolase [Ruminococcaceae bacterium]|nr:NUDIX hydrolase [Oscillospiraceae bacterium]
MPQNPQEIHLCLQDTEWPFDGITHSRQIVRGIVVDEGGAFYFVQVEREDEFGTGTFIETAGGGVEEGEELSAALLRELKEELGAEAKILGKIGVVEDDYHLIHRHNVSHYFLCKVIGFGERNLTNEEENRFRLAPQKLTYEQAVSAYETAADTPLGRLLYAREVPVLQRAKAMLK